jgi:uncharacterized protein YcfL
MNFIGRTILGAALAAALCGTAAASTPVVTKCNWYKARTNQPVPADVLMSVAPGALTPIPLDSVRMLDRKTAKAVFVEDVNARRTPTQTVEVTTRLFNCSKKPVTVVARTHFFDRDQNSVEPVTAWRQIVLAPGALTMYRERSVNARDVANFLIEVQKE